MKKLLCYSLFLVTAFRSIAQLPMEAMKPVPENVLKNASVIKRYENIQFDVRSLSKATYTVHQVYTVLNDAGKWAIQFQQQSDRFHSLNDVEIKVYDENGKQINKYKKKDLRTSGLGDGLVDDGFTHYFMIPAASYPVTVEYKYEIGYSGILSYPPFGIAWSGEGVVYSSYTARIPKTIDLRYKAKHINLQPTITEQGEDRVYTWTAKDLAALTYEEGYVGNGKTYPHILLAPNRFKIDDYEGDMSSWRNFGSWYNSVLLGTDKMTEEKKTFYKNMVKEAGSDREKIKIIYDYLQQNFRYVSIQLGIGGQKPFPADFTDNKKYGDCKGLSNYVYTVLKNLGIRSHLALINRDRTDEPVDPDFPCNQFNHVILCVPQPKDTIWLECTSKTNPFATLDISTENRNALLVTENGGLLISTPKSKASNNKIDISTQVLLSEDGSGTCSSNITATGEYREEMTHYLYDEKKDDQKQYLIHRMGFKQPDEFQINKKLGEPDFSSRLELKIEKIPEFTAGSKMFLAPYVYKFWSYQLPKSDNRKYDFYFECPFQKTDTTVYKLPAGYITEAIPSSKEFKCEYATYSSKYWFDEKERAVFTSTTLILNEQKIPVTKYAEVKSFFDNVLKEGSQRIVIKKM